MEPDESDFLFSSSASSSSNQRAPLPEDAPQITWADSVLCAETALRDDEWLGVQGLLKVQRGGTLRGLLPPPELPYGALPGPRGR